jgi:Transposase DDE domain
MEDAAAPVPTPDTPVRAVKRGRKPRPAARGEDLFGAKYVRMLQDHLAWLRKAHPHPNRTLFFDDVTIAYLLAFFTPAIRSLRTMEDFSQTEQMREQLGVDRLPRSTLSDANAVFDPTLLEPIIEDLRGRLPHLRHTDSRLAELTERVRVVDGSLFTVAADVAWALHQRRPDGKPMDTIRLNLQWAAGAGVPEGMTITGKGTSEAQALMQSLEPGVIYVMDRGYVCFELLDRIVHACSNFVLRLRSNNDFIPSESSDLQLKSRPLGKEDPAAGVIGDRIGRLVVVPLRLAPPAGKWLREVTVFNPDKPDEPLRLLTNILDVPAHIIALLYRWRWKIELFFRWLKVHAHFRHLTSHSKNGVTSGFYIAVIGVLLIYLHTQRPVSKYAYAMLSLVAAGQASLREIGPILERRERERELERQRLARKKAEKIGK